MRSHIGHGSAGNTSIEVIMNDDSNVHYTKYCLAMNRGDSKCSRSAQYQYGCIAESFSAHVGRQLASYLRLNAKTRKVLLDSRLANFQCMLAQCTT